VLLAVKNMGGETSEAWRAVLDDLVRRGPAQARVPDCRRRERAGADAGRVSGGDVPTQRCTVPQATATCSPTRPSGLHEEVSADYNDMIYAASAAEIEARRRAFIRKWRLKCKAVADSPRGKLAIGSSLSPRLPGRPMEERTDHQCDRNGSMRSSSVGSRPRRCCLRPKPQPCCSGRCSPAGQITMRKVDGWQTLNQKTR